MKGLTFDRGGQDRHYDMSAALNIERGRGLLHCGSGFSVLAVNTSGEYFGIINSMPSARTQSPDNVLKLGGARLIERLDSSPTAWVKGIRPGPFASCWVGGRLEDRLEESPAASASSTAPMGGAEGQGSGGATRELRQERRRAEQAEREMAQAKVRGDSYKLRAEAAEERLAAAAEERLATTSASEMADADEETVGGEGRASQEELARWRTEAFHLKLSRAVSALSEGVAEVTEAQAEIQRLERRVEAAGASVRAEYKWIQGLDTSPV